jgi:hypothetical protein
MRAQLFLCLTELITKKFGKEKLDAILAASGLSDSKTYMRYFDGFDFSDEKFVELVKNLCSILNITPEQAADAFGEYWVCEYAPRLYPEYYENIKNAEDFLTKLDSIHSDVTANSPSNTKAAYPPHFDVERAGDNTLHIHYKSKRRMIDFYIGLVKGVGKYFNTPLEIQKISEEEIDVHLGRQV